MSQSSKKRFQERAVLKPNDVEISAEAYNLIIGGVLLYGFIMNYIMVTTLFDTAYSLMSDNIILFFVGYILCCIVGNMMIFKSNNPIISFLGYNLIVLPIGIILSVTLNFYSIAGYDATISLALIATALVTIGIMIAATLFPNFFLSLGKTLFITLLITLVVEVILLLIGASLGIIDFLVVVIFCGYIGYDWARANQCAKTVDNAVDCAAELYLDIINLFLRLLRILARSSRN